MTLVRFRAFLIISSVLDIIALSIWTVVFQPESMVTKTKLMNVGVVNEYNKGTGIGNGRLWTIFKDEAKTRERASGADYK